MALQSDSALRPTLEELVASLTSMSERLLAKENTTATAGNSGTVAVVPSQMGTFAHEPGGSESCWLQLQWRQRRWRFCTVIGGVDDAAIFRGCVAAAVLSLAMTAAASTTLSFSVASLPAVTAAAALLVSVVVLVAAVVFGADNSGCNCGAAIFRSGVGGSGIAGNEGGGNVDNYGSNVGGGGVLGTGSGGRSSVVPSVLIQAL